MPVHPAVELPPSNWWMPIGSSHVGGEVMKKWAIGEEVRRSDMPHEGHDRYHLSKSDFALLARPDGIRPSAPAP